MTETGTENSTGDSVGECRLRRDLSEQCLRCVIIINQLLLDV